MRQHPVASVVVGCLFAVLLTGWAWSQPGPKPAAPPEIAKTIEDRTGVRGQWNAAESVFRVAFARTDLPVKVAGNPLNGANGLGVWAAFRLAGPTADVTGDLLLTEEQVNPVLGRALESGLEVTGLHNHFLWDEPRVMYMHFHGQGEIAALATAVGRVFAGVRDIDLRSPHPDWTVDPAQTTLKTEPIDAVLGVKGQMMAGVYKVTVGRKTTVEGRPMRNAMGVNTWMAFAGSDEQAVVDGDFAMLESEVQPVLKALHRAGIDILALHNHMLGDTPRIVFLHFWGSGPATCLARGLKSALDVQAR